MEGSVDSSGNIETEQLSLAGALLPGFQEEVSFRQSLRMRSAPYKRQRGEDPGGR